MVSNLEMSMNRDQINKSLSSQPKDQIRDILEKQKIVDNNHLTSGKHNNVKYGPII